MTTTTIDIQKYIDKLKEDKRKAEEKYDSDKAKESLASSFYSKKLELQGFLKGLVDMIKKSWTSGTDYTKTLDRTITQGQKIGLNTGWGISAAKILICQTIKTSNCIEMLHQQVGDLTDALAKCTITAGTVTGVITDLQKELDTELKNVTDLFNSLLATLQLEQDLYVSLSGTKGLVFQLTAMKNHAATGKKDDIDEVACRQHNPFLTPELETSPFYKSVKEALKQVEDEIPKALADADSTRSAREKSQAKKDALTNALTAATAAKSCDTKK